MMSDQKPVNSPKGVAAFDKAQLVRYADAARFLWGDEKSGQVADIIYGRNAAISALVFKLKPGGFFRSSDTWKSYFDQHRYYYVVQGELTIQDPSSGDVAVAKAGEVIHWQGAKWHFGYNFTSGETIVLDWYAPQERPPHIPEVVFAETKPSFRTGKAGRFDLLGKWPGNLAASREKTQQEGGVIAITQADALHFLYGETHPIRESIFVSSGELTAGVVDVVAGARSENRSHPGHKVIFNLTGQLHVYLPDSFQWFELNKWDVLYIPPNASHQYWSYTAEAAKFAFMVVPNYV
jgi:gentisate 1,2-dioxygenase